MLRDSTIIAKRCADMARDYRAMANTWRQVLDDTQPGVLRSKNNTDGKVGAPASSSDQELHLFVDANGREVS
jgi:hypothetical protein